MTLTSSYAASQCEASSTPAVSDLTPTKLQDWIIRRCRDFNIENINIIEFLQRYLFFVTMTFKPNSVTLNSNACSYLNARRAKLHPIAEYMLHTFNVNHFLLGNNLQRKRLWQPTSFCFVDAEGTKYGAPVRLDSKFPHIHSLVLVPPKLLARYRTAMSLCQFETQIADVCRWLPQSVDALSFENFDCNKGSLLQLADYCMKGYLNTKAADERLTGQMRCSERRRRDESLWRCLPN